MATNLGSVYATLELQTQQFQSALNQAKGSLDNFASTSVKSVGGLSGVMQGFGNQLVGIGNAFLSWQGAIAGIGLTALTYKIAEAGANLELYEATTKRLAINTNTTTEELESFRAALEDVNTFGGVATRTIGTFLRTGMLELRNEGETTTEFFQRFILATKDLAAAAGVSSKEAIEQMTQAIVQLSPQLLKTMGIQFNLTEVYREFAESVGKTTGELTELERRQAFLNGVFEDASKVGGVYKDVYDTAGKNLLSIRDAMTNVKEYLGSVLNPAFKQFTGTLLDALQDFVKYFEANRQKFEEMGNQLAKAAEMAIPLIVKVFKWLIDNKEFVIAFFAGLAIAIGAALIQFLAAHAVAVAIIAVMTVLIGLFIKFLPQIQAFAQSVITAFTNLKNAIQGFYDFIVKGDFTAALGKLFGVDEDNPIVGLLLAFREYIVEFFGGLFKVIAAIFKGENVLVALREWIGGTILAWTNLVAFIIGLVVEWGINLLAQWQSSLIRLKNESNAKMDEIITLILNWLSALPGRAYNALLDLPNKVKEIFELAWTFVTEELVNWPSRLLEWGKNIGQSFIEGLKQSLSTIKRVFEDSFNAARDVAMAQSPPREGPFSSIDVWGFNTGLAWVEGFQDAMSSISSAISSQAYSIDPNLAYSGQTNTSTQPVSFTVNIGLYAGTEIEKRQVAKELNDAYQDYLKGRGEDVVA